ncbi:MAG: hypothetical protein EAZ92_07205 [Candidatus Kapaibacterium sp.]|nr:MAG: hypothetical protein EAZ92_07205 [Candidatus Kapabacteria bacterium]
MNNSVREILMIVNGFSKEGIILVFGVNALDSIQEIANDYSVMFVMMIIVKAYKFLRDERRFDDVYVADYEGFTITCSLYKNRIFEITFLR